MSNFTRYCSSKTKVALYVEDIKKNLNPGSVLTTIIRPGLLGAYSVSTAIGASSEDIEREKAYLYFSPRMSISTEIIPDG